MAKYVHGPQHNKTFLDTLQDVRVPIEKRPGARGYVNLPILPFVYGNWRFPVGTFAPDEKRSPLFLSPSPFSSPSHLCGPTSAARFQSLAKTDNVGEVHNWGATRTPSDTRTGRAEQPVKQVTGNPPLHTVGVLVETIHSFNFIFLTPRLSFPLSFLLIVVTQIRGHKAGSSPSSPPHYGSCLEFNPENSSSLSFVVDSQHSKHTIRRAPK